MLLCVGLVILIVVTSVPSTWIENGVESPSFFHVIALCCFRTITALQPVQTAVVGKIVRFPVFRFDRTFPNHKISRSFYLLIRPKIHHEYPGHQVVSAPTPPSGSLQNMNSNFKFLDHGLEFADYVVVHGCSQCRVAEFCAKSKIALETLLHNILILRT
jgi:hypothetical protein